jgi:4-hydroxybenzoate polyprenyltransferase
LLLANLFWAVAYDTEYAMVDRDDDAKIGIQSSALFFGRYDVLAIMCCYLVMLLIFVYVGHQLDFGFYYFCSIAITASLILWQYVMIKDRIKTQCFKAFIANNWIGCALFFGLLAEYYL